MKPPDHTVPSGDRTMARSFLTALRSGGHDVALASRLRLHLHAPDLARQLALAAAAEEECERLARSWRHDGTPDLWFTYHSYHKAPDLLGPALARRFNLPYALAEASHAPKRAKAWSSWFASAEKAARAADLHICLTGRDRAGITPLLRVGGRILDLPPFLDLNGFPAPAPARDATPIRLVTVAMMRPGDKLDSYLFLAAALESIADLDWHLDIVGNGPARPAVEAAFANLPASHLAWHGALEPADVRDCLAEGEVFVWPGFGEAFGLAYLEAQALGLSAVALDVAGVSSVVEHGRTGLLVPDPDPVVYGAAIAALILDDARRHQLGRQASSFVRTARTVEAAAGVLNRALGELVAEW